MSSRGTAIDRVLNFYRTASADTVRVTHQLALEVMRERKIGGKPAANARGIRRGRKPQPAQTDSGASAAASATSGGN